MEIALIAAMAHGRVIGKDNQLPWHLPDDFKHFKQLTLNKAIIMGRKTFDSINQPLAKRHNIVLTHNSDFKATGVTVAHHIDQALQSAKTYAPEKEIMIIGGAGIYEAFLAKASTLYLTLVDANIDGDTRFPAWDDATWQMTSRDDHPADERHAYPFSFVTLKRTSSCKR